MSKDEGYFIWSVLWLVMANTTDTYWLSVALLVMSIISGITAIFYSLKEHRYRSK